MIRHTRRISLAVALLLLTTVAALAQPVFESKHSTLVEQYAAKFPPPGSNEDQLREWTSDLCEQFAFTFPQEGWGHKRASGPPSSDVIARQFSGRLYGWDLVIGAGTSGWRLEVRPGTMDITGQTFIAVSPVNHLGSPGGGGNTGGGGGDPGPSPKPPTVDLSAVLAELAATREAQQRTLTALIAMASALDDVRRLIEEQKNHDLVLADEIRKAAAEIREGTEKVRAQIAMGVRIRF